MGKGGEGEARARLREGERIVVIPEPPPQSRALPDADVRFEIMHVDDAIVVVNKPAGLVVHPSRGHERGTLVNGLLSLGLFRFAEVSEKASSHIIPAIALRLAK